MLSETIQSSLGDEVSLVLVGDGGGIIISEASFPKGFNSIPGEASKGFGVVSFVVTWPPIIRIVGY